MSYEHILVEQRGRVGIITMNHPERLNAWSASMEAEMRAAATAFDLDGSVGAIVFTGAGRGYCAGADISAFTAGIEARETAKATGAATARGASSLGEWTRFILR